MSKLDEEFWIDKEVKPQWAKDNQAKVIKRSELPGPWEVQPTDELFEPKVKIEIPQPRTPHGGLLEREGARFYYSQEVPVMKESNPKSAFGDQKLQLNVVPGSFQAYTSLALLEGALKYGRYNWRIKGVRVSTYLDALKRHIEKYEEGQWADPKTRVPHLANAAACLCIILDAGLMGSLNDDRPPSLPNHDQWIDGMTDIVQHLKDLFHEKNPKQYTIVDTPQACNSEESCPTS